MGRRCHHLTRKQEHEVVAFLNTILTPVEGSEGLVSYNDDWNDNKVSEKFGCTDNNIASLRKEFFGNLYNKKAQPKMVPADMYEHLLERIRFIEDQLGIKYNGGAS